MNRTVIAGIAAGIIVLGFIFAPMADEQFAAGKHFKRIVQTETMDSKPHRAVGHESHQAIEILPPMENVMYKGTLSYQASKSVDVLVYHKLTGEVMGQTVHEIDGIKYAVEKATSGDSGNVKFVGDAVLFHTSASEPFTVTASVAAQARALTGELPKLEVMEKPVMKVPTDVTTITISEFAPWFLPASLTIEPGTSVVWDANNAATTHTITFVTRVTDLELNMDKDFTKKRFTILAPGDKSAPWTPEPGVYVYVCEIHPYMTGTISVGVPYNAVTGEDSGIVDDPTTEMWSPWYPSWPVWTDYKPKRPAPTIKGVGEVWVDTQFEIRTDPNSPLGKFSKPWPGTITVVDAQTWEIKKKIDDKSLNNPHNLWECPDGRYVVQTNWHDTYLSVLDRQNRSVVKSYIESGQSPAHTFCTDDGKYVIATNNGGSDITVWDAAEVIDPNIPGPEVKPIDRIRVQMGPHGFWFEPDIDTISVPETLADSISLVDLEAREVVKRVDITELPDPFDEGNPLGPGIPLASYLGVEINGHRYWVTTDILVSNNKLLEGRLIIYDVGSKVGGPENAQFVKILKTGNVPIQSPISPDGKYVVTNNAGGTYTITQLDYNDPKNSRVVNTIPGYPGGHGVEYGYKQGGGYLAYGSHKFAPVLSVIDLTTSPPSLAGEVNLENGWGGMGILPLPNAAWYPDPEKHPEFGTFRDQMFPGMMRP